eukprot:CAMPEP_0203748826 /NCGR_PEP_ID=MMETSP0098-20131031/3603_1 /ASSEMBLY_ACC=CAM_ASM_000208 /TAXON_ID=96639 /ORGANISM=" , Strain NY0313808BC1" /LENGTH=230 /DNA_ID=CAMNT_0050637705 /DNA_START=530 /DNA_END=1222 /DNA_ORIENTATION=-
MFSTARVHANRLTKGWVAPPPREEDKKRNVLLVHAHPLKTSYSYALAKAAKEGLQAAGHEVNLLELYDVDGQGTVFKAALSASERAAYLTDDCKPAADVQEMVQLLQTVDALVFVYPTWWYNVPAVLKGFFDRTFLPGVAFKLPEDGTKGVLPGLGNINKIACVTTYGSPKSLVFLAGDNGRNMISRAILTLCDPLATISWLGLHNMDTQTEDNLDSFLGDVREFFHHTF